MKLYLCLLSILPTVITASPTIAPSSDIEPFQERHVPGEQYRDRAINTQREAVESGLHLGKRQSPICREACGKVDAKDCLATLAIAENAAELAGDTLFCAFREIRDFGS